MRKTVADKLRAAAHEEIRRAVADIVADTRIKSVLVTGPFGGEGVTTVAAAIATAVAYLPGKRVLLVDANIRAPGLHTVFGLPQEPGLMNWDGTADPGWMDVPSIPGLKLLAAGPEATVSSNGAGYVLGSRFLQRLESLNTLARANFDFIVWDSAPVVKFSDAKIISKFSDGVLFVVEADRTRMDHLAYARDQMQQAQANVIGAVMNRHGRYWPLKKQGSK